MMETDEIRELFQLQRKTVPSAAGVMPVSRMLPGVRFFPGGRGVWNDSPDATLPTNGVMVVGEDWGDLTAYRQAKTEETPPPPEESVTWKALAELLTEAELSPSSCFFTSFYMGLREKTSKRIQFPGAKSAEYVAACRDFLMEQINVVRPRLIVLLGARIPRRVAGLSSELNEWRNCKTASSLDRKGALKTNASFGSHHATVCWIVPPTRRVSNLRRRKFDGQKGAQAEVELIKQAARASGLSSK